MGTDYGEREGSCKFYLQPYCAALPLSLSSSSTFAFYRRSNDGMGEKRGKEGKERGKIDAKGRIAQDLGMDEHSDLLNRHGYKSCNHAEGQIYLTISGEYTIHRTLNT